MGDLTEIVNDGSLINSSNLINEEMFNYDRFDGHVSTYRMKFGSKYPEFEKYEGIVASSPRPKLLSLEEIESEMVGGSNVRESLEERAKINKKSTIPSEDINFYAEENRFLSIMSDATFFDDEKEDFQYKIQSFDLYIEQLVDRIFSKESIHDVLRLKNHVENYAYFIDNSDVFKNTDIERKDTIGGFGHTVIEYTENVVDWFYDENEVSKDASITNELHFIRAGIYSVLGDRLDEESYFDDSLEEFRKMKNVALQNEQFELYAFVCASKADYMNDASQKKRYFFEESLKNYERVIEEDMVSNSLIIFDYVAAIKAFEENIGIYSDEGKKLIERGKKHIDLFSKNNPTHKYVSEAKELFDEYDEEDEDFEDDV